MNFAISAVGNEPVRSLVTHLYGSLWRLRRSFRVTQAYCGGGERIVFGKI
jgi:hypothetical protein